MQLIKNLSRSKVLRVLGLALVFAAVISFQKPAAAEVGTGDRTLGVVVYNGDPIKNIKVANADVEIIGGQDGGIKSLTNSEGIAMFKVHAGEFSVRIRHNNFYTQDFPIIMNASFVELQAPLIPKDGPIDPGDPTGDNCTPTPPRGQPMLNIWPISGDGGNCRDYPLLMAKNLTHGSGYINGGTVNANSGDTIRVQLYVHNGVLDFPENEAINVVLKANMNGNEMSAEAWANNADRINSGQKGGDIRIGSSNFTLSYIPGSATLYDRNFSNPRALSDSIAGSGASVGNMKGCFPFLHFVTFDVRVNGPVVTQNTIKVIKEVINNNGGTASPTDFPLFVSGQSVQHNVAKSFNPGAYTVTETNRAGYSFVRFSGDCNSAGAIHLAAGQNAVCTVTNDDTAPPPPSKGTIKVLKEVINNNGGTALPTDFPLFVNGISVAHNSVHTFDAGTYTVTETNRAGYSFVKFSGDCNSAGVINLTAGHNLVCTVTNDDTEIKRLSDGYLDLADCATIGGWAIDGDTPNSPVTIKVYIDGPVGTGTLVATAIANIFRSDVGNHAYDIATPAAFRDGKSHTAYVYALDTTDGAPRLLNNSPRTIVCPIVTTNTIRVVKEVINNDGGTASPTDFPLFVSGQAIQHNVAKTFNVGSYTVTETNRAGYTFVKFSGDCNSAGVVNLAAGQNAVCTVTNDDNKIVTVGTIKITKQVRNVSQNQTSFAVSTDAAPGDQVEFQMKVTASNGPVNNVIFSDALPQGLNYINNSLTVDGTPSGNNLGAVSLGNMTSGQTKTVVIRAKVSERAFFSSSVTSLINLATVTSGANSDSAFATVVVKLTENADVNLSINKQVRNITQNQSGFVKSATAVPGDTVQFQIQVTANGNTTANNVVVTDTLPNNLTLSSGSLTHNLGNMNAGSTQTITFNSVVGSEGNFVCGSTTLTNSVTATSSNAKSVSDTANVVVTRTSNCGGGGSVSINLTKEVRNVTQNSGFSNSVNAANGDRVEFRIIVRASNGTANNVRVTDALPSGLTYVPGTFTVDSGSNSGNLFNGSYQFLGNISSGSSRTLAFQVTVNSSTTQTLVNVATAISDNTNSANASASVSVSGNANLVLSKFAYNQTRNVDATTIAAQPGDVIVYTLRVQNQGSAVANNFVFQDNLADVLQHSNLKDFAGAAFANLTLTWLAVNIPANSTVEKTFSVLVNNATPAGSDYIMTNVFGNTVNVRVAKVSGVFTAPPTGAGTALVFGLAFATVAGFWASRKQNFASLIKLLTPNKNV